VCLRIAPPLCVGAPELKVPGIVDVDVEPDVVDTEPEDDTGREVEEEGRTDGNESEVERTACAQKRSTRASAAGASGGHAPRQAAKVVV
jgi:hypothetical protein